MSNSLFFKRRLRLFYWAIQKVPPGQTLPWWAIAVKAFILPVETLGWLLTRQNHYDILTDTYVIHGVKYSGCLFKVFAKEGVNYFKSERQENTVIIEELHHLSINQKHV